MKVSLVFEDWKKDLAGKSVYNTPEGMDLIMGPFHHGTTFTAEIELDEEDARELKEAMKKGYVPVWATVDLLRGGKMRIAVQVSGKFINQIEVPIDADAESIERIALQDERVTKAVANQPIRKVIVVKDKLINIVT